MTTETEILETLRTLPDDRLETFVATLDADEIAALDEILDRAGVP